MMLLRKSSHPTRVLLQLVVMISLGLGILTQVPDVQGYACKAGGDCGSSSDPGRNSCGYKEKEQRYCPSAGDTCSGSTSYVCDPVCSNSGWTSNWYSIGEDSCDSPPPPPPPPPTSGPAVLLGRTFQKNASCPNGHNYYGDNCGTSACSSGPNYSVTWSQNGSSLTTNNNQCWEGAPRYTFEWAGSPTADADGELVSVSVQVSSADQQWAISRWNRTTTDSAGNICKPSESGTFSSPGLTQTTNITVYSDGDCKWNHVWYESVPTITVAGCYYTKNTDQRIGDATVPFVKIFNSEGISQNAPVVNGCFSLSNFISQEQGYAVRPDWGAPPKYDPPALTRNDTQSYIHCNNVNMNTPKGYNTYECQLPGQGDCGTNCNFDFTATSVVPKPEPTYECSYDNKSVYLRWKDLGDIAEAYIVRINIDKPCTNQSGETINWYCDGTGDQYAIVEAYQVCNNQYDPGYCGVNKQIIEGANYIDASIQWVGPDRNTVADVAKIGVTESFRCGGGGEAGLPDCTNLSGFTTVKPGVTATYEMTVDGSSAPVTGVSLMQRGASCASLNEVKTLTNLFVTEAGKKYSFNWTAPTTEGTYTLLGRVWSTPAGGTNWSECRAECLDSTNPLLYLCPSAQAIPGTCKLTVEVKDDSPPPPSNVTISGSVRLGSPTQNLNGSCPANQGNPYFGGGKVTPANGSSISLDGNGQFSFTRPLDTTQSIALKLDGYDGTLTCSCPGNQCSHSVSLAQDGTYDFYLTPAAESWWQAEGSHIYSANTLSYTIPAACGVGNDCKPYLIRVIEGYAKSAGIPISGGNIPGAIDTRRESDPKTAGAELVKNNSTKENYAYFAQLVGLEQITQTIGSNYVSAQNALNPSTLTDKDGRVTLVSKWEGGTLTIAPSPDNLWNIPNGQRHLIFVKGNLHFEQLDPSRPIEQLIPVSNGGFLMFVVSGNITIGGDVGNVSPQSDTPNLEGVYVANGSITIENDGDATLTDKKFVGGGSFVSWSSIFVNRDFSDAGSGQEDNATEPAQLFIFRPDLIKSVPPIITQSETIWQEVN